MKQVVVRGVETVDRVRAYSRQTKETETELVDLDGLVCEATGIAKPRMAAMGRMLRVAFEPRQAIMRPATPNPMFDP